MIALLKFGHIATLAVWCAGLLVLPLLLTGSHREARPSRRPRACESSPTMPTIYCVSPAAVVATIAGGGLIFARDLFHPWLFAKLGFVGALVVIHTYLGHCVVELGEKGRVSPLVHPYLLLAAAFAVMTAILLLVLAKPVISPDLMPDWLRTPLDRQLPFPTVPS
jgi:putative membrane protein